MRSMDARNSVGRTVHSLRARLARLGLLGLLGALPLVATVGCLGSGGSSAKIESAKASVVAFLEAIKHGDDTAAQALLTKVARAKTAELGISVTQPFNDTASYAIRECEMVGEADDLVHVGTTWTDTDKDGFKTTENVIWVVRLDPEGWRVVGMATRVFEDLPPLLLNFEDPEDMIAKQEMVAQELEKRAKNADSAPASRTARGSDSSTDGQSKVQ
jgi:hypothetical protein